MNDRTRKALIEFAELLKEIAEYSEIIGHTDRDTKSICSEVVNALRSDETIPD